MKSVFVSFYTSDDYYLSAANELMSSLDNLGLLYDFERVDNNDQDWAATTRRKLQVLRRALDNHPGSLVFWIDADSSIIRPVPEFILNSTADFIGFQRGFARTNRIGYSHFTRFWSPTFFGLRSSDISRQFLDFAILLETQTKESATDDFFIEEAWRKFGDSMTFQVIPSSLGAGKRGDSADETFFFYGASGNVKDFQNKVLQHSSPFGSSSKSQSVGKLWRLFSLYNGLPPFQRRIIFSLAKMLGIVSLVRNLLDQSTGNDSFHGRAKAVSKLTSRAVVSAKRGDSEGFLGQISLIAQHNPNSAKLVKARGESYLSYLTPKDPLQQRQIRLRWWDQPPLGNFGDWLSPLIIKEMSGHPVRWVGENDSQSQTHLIGLGSIARLANRHSIVFGSGISSKDQRLDPNSAIISVRGPETASVLTAKQKRGLVGLGDPGVLLRRVFPELSWGPEAPGLLVRHYAHQSLPIDISGEMREVSVHARSPGEIHSMLKEIVRSEFVITSAMHVLVACHSFGVPAALVDFEDYPGAVSGDGVKYEDYSQGAGLDKLGPQSLPLNAFTNLKTLTSLVTQETISEQKLDEVEASLRAAIIRFTDSDL